MRAYGNSDTCTAAVLIRERSIFESERPLGKGCGASGGDTLVASDARFLYANHVGPSGEQEVVGGGHDIPIVRVNGPRPRRPMTDVPDGATSERR